MKLRHLFISAFLFTSINSNALYILIHEESNSGIMLRGGITKWVLEFKIGQLDNAIKFGDINTVPFPHRKPPIIFGFDEDLNTRLPEDVSERLLSLLQNPPVEILNYTPSPEIIDPMTGFPCAELPKTVPCANIFNFIQMNIKDRSGRGFIVESSEKVNLLMAAENNTLKVGDVVLFRNTDTRRIGNVMLHIGHNVLMGWDGEFFFFQSVVQAVEYFGHLFKFTTEISRKVIPFSDITTTFEAHKPDVLPATPNYRYDPALLPIDKNNLPSYIK